MAARPLSNISIAIVGGGIGGLCLAAGLTKLPHLDVRIYEGVAAYSDVGAGLALHPNAIRAMELIGPEVKRAYFSKAIVSADEEEQEMGTQVILAAGPHSGEVVAELGRAKGRKTVARADLLDGLRELIPRERIQFGKRLAKIEEAGEGVVLTFTDTSTASVDCLVGADGVHSATRAYLLGDDHSATKPVNHDGWHMDRRMVPMEEAKQAVDARWTKDVPILCGPGAYLNSMPLHYGKTLSIAVVRKGASTGGRTPPLRIEAFDAYNEDARILVELVSREPSTTWVLQDHDPAPFYCRDHVAMIGDAAHATLPFAGNGAAQAIEDAAVLNALFAKITDRSQIRKLFTAFDATRRPRSQRVVEISREFGRFYALELEGVGHELEKMRSYFKTAASFTSDADLQAQNDAALRLFACSLKTDTEA